MKNRLLLFGVLVMLAALFIPSVVAQDDGPSIVVEPGDDVVIGLATILSGEGLVPLGEDIVRGVELALEDRPSVTVGEVEFTLALDVQDDQCSREGGQAVASLFASDPRIVAVVGPTCSSACAGAGPIFDEAGYSMISSSCTAPNLTDPEDGFASFNRTTPNDSLQGAAAARFIFEELGVTSVATIHDGSPYGEGLTDVLAEAFTALGGEVVFADAVSVGDTDFRTLLEDVAAAQPGLIYFGGFPAEAARLIQQRAEVGLAETPFMGADGIRTPELISQAGEEAAEGVYASSPIPPAGEAVDSFVARYVETYGLEPTAAFHTYSYDATNVILDAIEAVGSIDDDGNLVVSRAALRDYIRSYGAEEPVAGLSGVLSCNGMGDCASGDIGFFQVMSGAYETLEYVVEGTSLMGDEMMDPMATEEATEEAGG